MRKKAAVVLAGILAATTMMTAVPAMAADNYETGTVTAYRLFVRDGGSMEDKIIGGLKRGTDIEIVGTAESGWYKIIYEGEVAYASNKYIAVDDEEAIARAHELAIQDAANAAAIAATTIESEDETESCTVVAGETESEAASTEAESETASTEAESEATSTEETAESEETSTEAAAESEETEEASAEETAESETASTEAAAESEETEEESTEETAESEAASTEETAESEESAEESEEETAESEETSSSSSYVIDASEDDVALLAALIYCEAGGESREGKVAVGAVVVNRVKSSSYPNTISGVIYQSGQFTPASSGKLATILAQGANSDCYEAAVAALTGENPIGDKLHFNGGTGQGIQIGNQHFY